MAPDNTPQAAPSKAVSIAVSAAAVVIWTVIRLFVFDTVVLPLTYVLPLLICVWTRDRLALWVMAAVFALLHLMKLYWLLPADTLSSAETLANLTATLANIVIGAVAVHAIILLRSRLEHALSDVRTQADELKAQGEELTQQNEELSAQTEELSRQGEELAAQNEELQSQSEEIAGLNDALSAKERLLQTLLDIPRQAGGEQAALHHISAAAPALFGDACSATAIYEQTPQGVRLFEDSLAPAPAGTASAPNDSFAALLLEENRTAALDDTALRPDLVFPALPNGREVRAVLGAPIRIGGRTIGTFIVYHDAAQDWSQEHFRLAEWFADQCGRVLDTLRMQEALRDTDRRKSEFLATLSHELRNPLAPLRFALQLIERGGDRDGKALRIMDRQLQQLVRLVDDLLDATRLSNNKIQLQKARCDFVAIVQQAVEASKPDVDAGRHTIDVALPPHPVWIVADSIRMTQVVINLLNNACRYTPAGGTITVTLSLTSDEAGLVVADTGVGLAADHLARVFDMFTQLSGPGSGGLGIGLALVKGIVELHDGRVDARSDGAGRGSQFRVSLPLAPIVDAPVPVDAVAVAPPGQPRRRVLIVDDNADSTEMLAAILEAYGHAVWVAHDAATALNLANQVRPDVGLLDIGLPGTDGYELAQQLRTEDATRHMRLIAVTGWGQEADRARARAVGFDAHLTKPAEPNAILSALDTATGAGDLPQGV